MAWLEQGTQPMGEDVLTADVANLGVQMPPVTPAQDESKKFASTMNDVNSKYQDSRFPSVLLTSRT